MILESPSKKDFFPYLWILHFCMFSTYAVALSFFPSISKSHGLSPTATGIIFSFYPMGGLIIGFLTPKLTKKYNKKILLYFFLVSLGFFVILFGLTKYIENKFLFAVVAALSRFGQGFSAGAYEALTYAFIPMTWPDDIERRLGILEIAAGVGVGSGPMIGSIIYFMFGYFAIFAIQSLYIIAIGFYVNYYHLPEQTQTMEEISNRKEINMLEIIKNKNILFLGLILCFTYSTLTSIMTDFENYILDLGGSSYLCSFLFFIGNIDYIFSIVLINYLRKRFNRVLVIDFSILVLIFALFLIGHQNFFILKNSSITFIIIGLGMFIQGLGLSLIIILFIPECIILLSKANPSLNQEEKSEIASSLYVSFLSAAELIGPIIGGIFADSVGFSKGCFEYNIFLSFFFVSYLIWGNGLEGWETFKKKKEESLLGKRKESYNLI